ncbi:MAG: hypothetical protein K8R89_09050 [Anaerolineae bacterium]|nr:hypothetical protein [Anaerolineae bacterium]
MPTPTPSPVDLAGKIIFLRDGDLWAMWPDGTELEQVTFDSSFTPAPRVGCPRGADLTSPVPGTVIYASRTPFETNTPNVVAAPIPEECTQPLSSPLPYGCGDIDCRCFGFLFSPDNRWLAYVYVTPRNQFETRIIDLAHKTPIAISGGMIPAKWLPTGQLILSAPHCGGATVKYWEPNTYMLTPLETYWGDWNPSDTAFVTCVQPYQGPKYLWGYDFERKIVLESVDRMQDYVGSAFWTPGYDGYVYTRATISCTLSLTEERLCPIGPRELWLADTVGQHHTCVVCDPAYDFDVLGRVDGQLLVRRTPFQDNDDTYLDIAHLCDDYRDCEEAVYYLINWETGEWFPSTLTAVPWPSGPSLEATPVYTEPSREWWLVLGVSDAGLWRVFADGQPSEVVIPDGTKFIWVSPHPVEPVASDDSTRGIWLEAALNSASPTAPRLEFDRARWHLTDHVPGRKMLVHQVIDNCHISQSTCHGLGPGWSVQHDSVRGASKNLASYQGELRFVNYCMLTEGLDVCFAVGCKIADENERETCIRDAEAVLLRTLRAVPNQHLTPTPGGAVWRILFKGAPCAEMLNPGCQPFDDTPIYSYIINSNGTGLEKIESLPPISLLSPDGTHLAYATGDGLYVANADGTNPVRVLDYWVTFDFSPDGKYIVYGERQIGGNDLDVVQAQIGYIQLDSLTQVILATLPTAGASVYVSPDGDWILARGRSRDPITYHLYLVGMENGEVRELFHFDHMGPVRWSPDGTEVEFVAFRKEDETYITVFYTMDRNGKNLRPTLTITHLYNWLSLGDWSPNGREFAFAMSPKFEESEPGLYVLDLNNGYWHSILPDYYVGFVETCAAGFPR